MNWRTQKYKNRIVEINGERFDSVLEAERYGQLVLLQRAGVISDLQRQVRFEIIPKVGNRRAKYYIADFVYTKNGEQVVEDTKGIITDVFRLKEHLMAWRYGINVNIVKRGDL